MGYETIRYEVESDGILLITLNRPDKMNSFTVQMADELEHAFRGASADDNVRAVIVTGAGRAFCAGMDLSVGDEPFGLDYTLQPTIDDMRDRLDAPEIVRGVRDTGGRVVLAIHDCLKPVIGAINGVAVGVGATMTLPMDIRIATEEARIGFVFGRIGIVPEACSTWFLPRIVGIQQALEWVYAADIMPAAEALSGGLLKAVHPAAALLDEARALARRFTQARSPVATALTRRLLYHNSAAPSPLEAHMTDSLAIFYAAQKDGKEGVRAFLEKRSPEFAGRVSTDMPPGFPWWRDPVLRS